MFCSQFINPCFIHNEDEFTLSNENSSEDEVNDELERKEQFRKTFWATLLLFVTCSIFDRIIVKRLWSQKLPDTTNITKRKKGGI